MDKDNLEKSIINARNRGYPEILLRKVQKIIELELEENKDCPVPDCLIELLNSDKKINFVVLDETLYRREEHFLHQGNEIFYRQ